MKNQHSADEPVGATCRRHLTTTGLSYANALMALQNPWPKTMNPVQQPLPPSTCSCNEPRGGPLAETALAEGHLGSFGVEAVPSGSPPVSGHLASLLVFSAHCSSPEFPFTPWVCCGSGSLQVSCASTSWNPGFAASPQLLVVTSSPAHTDPSRSHEKQDG